MDEEIGKNRAIYSKDRIVKRLLENRELRAEFFKSTIAELKDKTREEIMSWMEDDGDSPKGLNTENVLPNGGMVRYDALYRVKIPSEGDLGIYVNIEAQGQNSALEQDCRSVTYCGTLLSLQVADLGRRRGYRYLDRVYSIWICLDPPKERKGSVYVGRVWMKEADTDGPLEMMKGNLLNIVYVNLRGNGEETDSAATRLMGILLGDLPERKKLDLIRDRFNIDLGDGYTEGVNTNFIYQDAYEEGFQKGEAEGMAQGMAQGMAEGMTKGMAQGRAEERSRHIRAYADQVLSLAKVTGSVEDALQIMKIPEDCIDEVRAKVLERRRPAGP